MKITSLGAGQEVGRSAFVINIDGKNILFDYGVKIFDKTNLPQYPLSFSQPIDLTLISHAHLDHIGHLPALYKEHRNMEWISTPPTIDIGEVLWKDAIKLAKIKRKEIPYTHKTIEKAKINWHPALYNQVIEKKGLNIQFYDAGHILGSASISVESGNTRIIYSGDYKGSPTELHTGLEHPGEADVLLTEATYWDKEHPKRKDAEMKLIESIKEIHDNGGIALIAAFALGRTQEIAKIVTKYTNYPVFIDGMGKEITKIYLKYPGYLKDFIDFKNNVEKAHIIMSNKDRKRALNTDNAVIITTAGMLEGGPILYYVQNTRPNSGIILTGYQVEGSNGRLLLDEGKLRIDEHTLNIDMPVYHIDFSAHAGRSELLYYVKKANPEHVIVEHVDGGNEFVNELKNLGFNAIAIKTGQTLKI